jgi:hypothetical protein
MVKNGDGLRNMDIPSPQRATEFSFGFTALDVPQHQGAIAAAHDGTLQVWGVAQGLQKKNDGNFQEVPGEFIGGFIGLPL